MDCPYEIHQQVSHRYGVIDTIGLRCMINAKTPMIILDARAYSYDDGYRIPGARNLYHKTTAEEAATVIPGKDSLVIVYCTNIDCPASQWLAERLIQLGYTNIVKYPQGIEAWMDEGNPVDIVEKNGPH